ncbi:MAG: hypothetical protein ACREB3_11430 [Burkholderiales bacterium]
MKNGELSNDVPTAAGRALSFIGGSFESGRNGSATPPAGIHFPAGEWSCGYACANAVRQSRWYSAGSTTLGGCGSPVEQRDAYSKMQDCIKDWTDTSLCEPVRA